MNYQYQGDTTPSCRQLMAQPIQFTPGYMPPIPNVPGLPPPLAQALPHIAMTAANACTAHAQANPLYVFYFNLTSQAGWRNQWFENLVNVTARYTWLLIEQAGANNIGNAIAQAAEEMSSLMASVTAMENPVLQQFVDPGLWASASNIASKWMSLNQQFNMLGQARQQVNQTQVYGNQAPVYGGVAVDQFQPAAATAYYTPPGQAGAQERAAVVDPLGGNATIYRRRTMQTDRITQELEKERYSGVKIPGFEQASVQDVSPKQPAAKVMAMNKDQVKTYEVPQFGQTADTVFATPKEWAPSPRQWFEPAYDVNTQKLTYEVVSGPGKYAKHIAAIVAFKTPEEIEMDREAHVITTARTLYQSRVPEGVPTRVTGVSKDLELAAKAVLATANKEDDEATKAFRELNLVALDPEVEITPKESLTGLVTWVRLQRLKIQPTGTRSAFSTTGRLATYFVAPTEMSKRLFEKLVDLKTLKQVAEYLREFATNNANGEAAALVWRVERFITQRVLHVIRRRMGLSEFTFDSLIDDIDAVFEVMEKDWGVVYSNALHSYEGELIKSLFEESSFGFYALDDTNTEVAASEIPVTVTLVDADVTEFGVNVPGDKSYEVFPSNFPGFYDFIQAIVTTKPEAHHHYIVTEDDKVYEVSRSLVGSQVLLVSNGPSI